MSATRAATRLRAQIVSRQLAHGRGGGGGGHSGGGDSKLPKNRSTSVVEMLGRVRSAIERRHNSFLVVDPYILKDAQHLVRPLVCAVAAAGGDDGQPVAAGDDGQPVAAGGDGNPTRNGSGRTRATELDCYLRLFAKEDVIGDLRRLWVHRKRDYPGNADESNAAMCAAVAEHAERVLTLIIGANAKKSASSSVRMTGDLGQLCSDFHAVQQLVVAVRDPSLQTAALEMLFASWRLLTDKLVAGDTREDTLAGPREGGFAGHREGGFASRAPSPIAAATHTNYVFALEAVVAQSWETPALSESESKGHPTRLAPSHKTAVSVPLPTFAAAFPASLAAYGAEAESMGAAAVTRVLHLHQLGAAYLRSSEIWHAQGMDSWAVMFAQRSVAVWRTLYGAFSPRLAEPLAVWYTINRRQSPPESRGHHSHNTLVVAWIQRCVERKDRAREDVLRPQVQNLERAIAQAEVPGVSSRIDARTCRAAHCAVWREIKIGGGGVGVGIGVGVGVGVVSDGGSDGGSTKTLSPSSLRTDVERFQILDTIVARATSLVSYGIAGRNRVFQCLGEIERSLESPLGTASADTDARAGVAVALASVARQYERRRLDAVGYLRFAAAWYGKRVRRFRRQTRSAASTATAAATTATVTNTDPAETIVAGITRLWSRALELLIDSLYELRAYAECRRLVSGPCVQAMRALDRIVAQDTARGETREQLVRRRKCVLWLCAYRAAPCDTLRHLETRCPIIVDCARASVDATTPALFRDVGHACRILDAAASEAALREATAIRQLALGERSVNGLDE